MTRDDSRDRVYLVRVARDAAGGWVADAVTDCGVQVGSARGDDPERALKLVAEVIHAAHALLAPLEPGGAPSPVDPTTDVTKRGGVT